MRVGANPISIMERGRLEQRMSWEDETNSHREKTAFRALARPLARAAPPPPASRTWRLQSDEAAGGCCAASGLRSPSGGPGEPTRTSRPARPRQSPALGTMASLEVPGEEGGLEGRSGCPRGFAPQPSLTARQGSVNEDVLSGLSPPQSGPPHGPATRGVGPSSLLRAGPPQPHGGSRQAQLH